MTGEEQPATDKTTPKLIRSATEIRELGYIDNHKKI